MNEKQPKGLPADAVVETLGLKLLLSMQRRFTSRRQFIPWDQLPARIATQYGYSGELPSFTRKEIDLTTGEAEPFVFKDDNSAAATERTPPESRKVPRTKVHEIMHFSVPKLIREVAPVHMINLDPKTKRALTQTLNRQLLTSHKIDNEKPIARAQISTIAETERENDTPEIRRSTHRNMQSESTPEMMEKSFDPSDDLKSDAHEISLSKKDRRENSAKERAIKPKQSSVTESPTHPEAGFLPDQKNKTVETEGAVGADQSLGASKLIFAETDEEAPEQELIEDRKDSASAISSSERSGEDDDATEIRVSGESGSSRTQTLEYLEAHQDVTALAEPLRPKTSEPGRRFGQDAPKPMQSRRKGEPIVREIPPAIVNVFSRLWQTRPPKTHLIASEETDQYLREKHADAMAWAPNIYVRKEYANLQKRRDWGVLAHEMTHVAQQMSESVPSPPSVMENRRQEDAALASEKFVLRKGPSADVSYEFPATPQPVAPMQPIVQARAAATPVMFAEASRDLAQTPFENVRQSTIAQTGGFNMERLKDEIYRDLLQRLKSDFERGA